MKNNFIKLTTIDGVIIAVKSENILVVDGTAAGTIVRLREPFYSAKKAIYTLYCMDTFSAVVADLNEK